MLKILIAEDDRELRQLFIHVLNRATVIRLWVCPTVRKHWMQWIQISMI